MTWNGPTAKISRLKIKYFMINKGKPPEKRHDPEREPQCQDIVGVRQEAEKRPRETEGRWREIEN